MRKYFLIIAYLVGVVPLQINANPLNPGNNPLVSATAIATPLAPPVGSMATARFYPAIDNVDLVSNLSNYSLRQVAPELGAGTPGGKLEDLDGDGDLDLVYAKGHMIMAHENTGTVVSPRFSPDSVVLALVAFFNTNNTMTPSGWYVNFTFADLDGNGSPDLICGEAEDGQISCFYRENTATQWPSYGVQKKVLYSNGVSNNQIRISAETSSWWFDIAIPSVALEDLDGDTMPDLVVGDPYGLWGQPQNLTVYRGTGETIDGSPVFSLPVQLRAGGSTIVLENTFIGATCPVFHDYDGDGDRDLIVSTTTNGIWLFEADGVDGNSSSSNFGFPLFDAPQLLKDAGGVPYEFGSVSAIQVCDYSADGDADLLMVSRSAGALEQNRLRLLENLEGGDLRFRGEPLLLGVGGLSAELRTSYTSKVACFDFDGDGKMDLLYSGDGYGLAISYNLDTGDNHEPCFAAPVILELPGGAADLLKEGVPEVVDFNEDGELAPNVDGLLVGTFSNLFFLAYKGLTAEGFPDFAVPVSVLPSGFQTLHYLQPSVGDVDGNGTLDVILVSGGMYSGETRNLLLLANESESEFAFSSSIPVTVGGQPNSTFMFPELVDFDGDNDLDLLVSERSASFNRRALAKGTLRLLRNDGAGGLNFVDQGVVEHTPGVSVAVASDASARAFDFNFDGRLDLLVASGNSAVTPVLAIAGAPGVGIVLSPPSPVLQVTATLASSVVLSTDRKRMRLDFPMLVSAGSALDMNDLRVGGDRAAIWGIPLAVDVDSDQDGLWDEWEIDSFGHLDFGPGDDYDGDGVSNLDEYKRGLNPLDPDSDGDGIPDGLDSHGLYPDFIYQAPTSMVVWTPLED